MNWWWPRSRRLAPAQAAPARDEARSRQVAAGGTRP